MFEKNTLLKGALILIVSLAVLQFVQPAVMSIDTSTLPSWEVQVVVVVQHFFEVTPIALLAGFGWSLFGYIRYKLGDQTVQYEVEKLYSTFMWFEGMIVIVAVGLPAPLATTIAGIIMAVKSVFNALKTAPTTAMPTPTGPGPPSPS